ncbi:hypothetical protein LZ32DRAFT_23170 [Colletotrichum eremochloae]|nr:hypothetical protein LZ32DRAFT_23170 [Colletotrichum eremochloae]
MERCQLGSHPFHVPVPICETTGGNQPHNALPGNNPLILSRIRREGKGSEEEKEREKKKPRFSRLKRAAASRRPRHSLFRSWILGSRTPFPQGKQRQEAASSRCTLSHLTRRPPVRLCLPKDVSASPPRATRCRPDRPPCPPSGPHREPSASACRRGPRGPIPSRAKKPFPSPLWADYTGVIYIVVSSQNRPLVEPRKQKRDGMPVNQPLKKKLPLHLVPTRASSPTSYQRSSWSSPGRPHLVHKAEEDRGPLDPRRRRPLVDDGVVHPMQSGQTQTETTDLLQAQCSKTSSNAH